MRFKIDRASLQWEGNLPFLLCFTLCSRANSKYKSPGGLYSEGRFHRGFFALRFWGAYIWRDLYMERLIFGILRYFWKETKQNLQSKHFISLNAHNVHIMLSTL